MADDKRRLLRRAAQDGKIGRQEQERLRAAGVSQNRINSYAGKNDARVVARQRATEQSSSRRDAPRSAPMQGTGGFSIGLNDRGRLAKNVTDWKAKNATRLKATDGSRRKVNQELKANDWFLSGGDGRVAVGTIGLQHEGRRNFGSNKIGARWAIEPGKEYLTVYAAAPTPPDSGRRRRRRGDGSGEGPNSSPAPSPQASAAERTRTYAEDRLYGRVPEGRKPEMFPSGGPEPGRAPEAIANYVDRLDTYNQNTIGWMNDRAVSSDYEMGMFLDNFVDSLPPAPDIYGSDELEKIAKGLSRINFV